MSSQSWNQELVSVIIPVYNVEKYVKRCLDSIMNQTYRNLEIIVVNNMSTDNSWNIVKEIAATDSRIVLRECYDQGLSQTRNAGLDVFTGQWIIFADSDDMYEASAIERLMTKAHSVKADIVSGPFRLIDSNENVLVTYSLPEYHTTDKDELLIFSLTRFVNRSSVAGRLYRAELFKYRRFIPSLYGEDYPFLYDLLKEVNSYATVPDYVYLYRQNFGSLTKAVGIKRQLDGALATYNTALDFADFPKSQPYFFGSTFKVLMYLLGSTYTIRKNDCENWGKAVALSRQMAFRGRVNDFPTKAAMWLIRLTPHLAAWLMHLYFILTYGKWAKEK